MYLSLVFGFILTSYVAAIPLPRSSNIIGIPVIAANSTHTPISSLVDQAQDGVNYQEWLDQSLRARMMGMLESSMQDLQERGGI